jgi:hypothetical protein
LARPFLLFQSHQSQAKTKVHFFLSLLRFDIDGYNYVVPSASVYSTFAERERIVLPDGTVTYGEDGFCRTAEACGGLKKLPGEFYLCTGSASSQCR